MREQLIQYVQLLFAGAADCDDTRQEILQNTLDRYDDLIAAGKTPEAAYRLAIMGIGDINEILGRTSGTPAVMPVPARQMGTLYACRERRAGRRLHGAFLGTELRGSQQSESPAYQSLCVVCLPWGAGRGKTLAG